MFARCLLDRVNGV